MYRYEKAWMWYGGFLELAKWLRFHYCRQRNPPFFLIGLNWDSLSIDLGFQDSDPIKNPHGMFFYLLLVAKNCSLRKGSKQSNFGSFSRRMKTWFVTGKLFREMDLIPKNTTNRNFLSSSTFWVGDTFIFKFSSEGNPGFIHFSRERTIGSSRQVR